MPWVLLDTAVASVGRRLALVYWPALATQYDSYSAFLLNDPGASRTSEEGVDTGVLVTDIHERVFGQCAELKERFDHLNRRAGVEVTLAQAGWYEASLSNATDSALLPR